MHQRAVSRRHRNRRMGEFLKELDLTEGRSTGLPKILRVMQQNGSPAPIVETDDERSYFLVRLPIHAGFVASESEASAINAETIEQVTHQVKTLLLACSNDLNRAELMQALGLKDRVNFREIYLQPALEQGLIEMTQPDSPRSPTQKYHPTALGRHV